ncbi:oxidoreductase [uncultured Marixanthomonas sp.]|uniref:WD40/YVTN/BNR-like repeat-containing protein n=1 Tax=uncultured Marixanthomonas sp. TaxID=757245 RepID=UPI0030DBF61E|tara:strand:- start:7886 stop:8926 length:1041 start_codon:yes stop_codon:yes gene_type:complete
MRFFPFLLVLVGLASCTSNHSKNFTSVDIEPVFIDSLSIRAIQPLDENRVWFAADKGIVGLIDNKQAKLATIKYEDSLLHFRSIAATDSAAFVLSISNPAVLYKIGFNGKEATNIQEVYTENGENVFYDSMKFWNNMEGIAMGDPVDDCLSILITQDGGNTWEKIPCDNLPKVETGEAAFAASNSNIALYKNNAWIATGGKQARVFHSKNKGKDWEVYDTPIVQGKAMTGIYSVDFFDAKIGVIFGGDWDKKEFNEGNKAITNNGGKTWRLLSNGKGPGYRSSVKFVPNTKGNDLVAVGSPGLSYSNDQGENWQELSKEGFYAIEFVNDSIAFASGNNKISKIIFK